MAINTAEVIANVAFAWGAGSLIGLERPLNVRSSPMRLPAPQAKATLAMTSAVLIAMKSSCAPHGDSARFEA